MERLTKRLDDGKFVAEDKSTDELITALGKFEDMYESIVAEQELVRLNMEALSAMRKASSATYTMLMGSKYMLKEMVDRFGETPEAINERLEKLKKLIEDDGRDEEGFKDVE